MSRIKDAIARIQQVDEIEKRTGTVTVRLDDYTIHTLENMASQLGMTKTALGRLIIENGLDDVLEAEGLDPKLSVLDYQVEVLGIEAFREHQLARAKELGVERPLPFNQKKEGK